VGLIRIEYFEDLKECSMGRVSSIMMPLGSPQPDFELSDAHGRIHRRDECRGPNGTLVMFLCNHCPFVQHVTEAIRIVSRRAGEFGVGVVGIMSNDFVAYPDDAPPKMIECAKSWGWDFPYLIDERQTAAKAHGAVCTPDFFLYDSNGRLYYRGQVDSSRPGCGLPSNGEHVLGAMKSLAAGEPPPKTQLSSIGCNIKWRL
jgi:peroxiredoxin